MTTLEYGHIHLETTPAHLHWHTEPALLVGFMLGLLLYALGVGPLRQRLAPNTPFPRRQAGYFVLALMVLYGAVASPLGVLWAGVVFSWSHNGWFP